MLSAYDYWQFWRNTEDADVGKFLRLFTFLPMGQIARLEALAGAEINEAKKVLATEATALMHGRAAAEAAAETARTTFAGGTAADLPTVEPEYFQANSELGILNAVVMAGLTASNGEARRLIASGGVSANNVVVSSVSMILTPDDAIFDGSIKISVGKKKHAPRDQTSKDASLEAFLLSTPERTYEFPDNSAFERVGTKGNFPGRRLRATAVVPAGCVRHPPSRLQGLESTAGDRNF